MKKILLLILSWSILTRVYDGHEDAEEIEDIDKEEQYILEEEEFSGLRKKNPLKSK